MLTHIKSSFSRRHRRCQQASTRTGGCFSSRFKLWPALSYLGQCHLFQAPVLKYSMSLKPFFWSHFLCRGGSGGSGPGGSGEPKNSRFFPLPTLFLSLLFQFLLVFIIEGPRRRAETTTIQRGEEKSAKFWKVRGREGVWGWGLQARGPGQGCPKCKKLLA